MPDLVRIRPEAAVYLSTNVQLDAEEVVAVLQPPLVGVQLQPFVLPPWAMMTPSAPDAGTYTSAVTEYDLFLMLMTEFSLRRPIPPNRICVWPR